MNIKIGGQIFKVIFVNDLRDETGKRVNGTIMTDQCSIYIATDVTKQKQHSILIHEVLHGIHTHYDVEGTEHIVAKIANGIYAFIVDNPIFIKELIKHNEKLREEKK